MNKLKIRIASFFFSAVLIFFCIICCAEPCTTPQEKSDTFYSKVVARNSSAYVWWHAPLKSNNDNEITNIKIFYKEYSGFNNDSSDINDDFFDDTVECAKSDNKYLINNLLNDHSYLVRVVGCDDSQNDQYKEDFVVTPGTFTVEFDNVTALIIDNKIYFSWAFSQCEKESFKTVNIYSKLKGVGISITDVKSTVAYEKILNEYYDGTDTCPRYDTYYSCVCDDFFFALDSTNFIIRAVNQNGVESDEYVIVCAYETDIPVVMMDFDLEADYEDFTSQKKVPATLSVTNDFEGNNLDPVELTVKGRGNSSWKCSPKKSYTIKFDKKCSFLGMKKARSFALIANYFDKSLMRNALAYNMAKDLFTNLEWTPDCVYTDLFINGVYQGVYLCVETPKINNDRINIPNLENCTNVEDFENFGWLIEANVRSDESFNYTTTKQLVFSLKDPDGDDISEKLKECIKEKIQNIEDALYSEDFDDPESPNYWKNYLDEKSLIDWILLEEYAKNPDSNMYSSCYMYFNPEDKKLHFGPVWDFDLGFGNTEGATYSGFITTSKWTYNSVSVDYNWFARLKESDGFTDAVKQRYQSLYDDLYDYFSQYENFLFDNLKSSIKMNFARWNILGNKTYKSPVGYEDRVTFSDEIDFLKEWIENRFNWINENL